MIFKSLSNSTTKALKSGSFEVVRFNTSVDITKLLFNKLAVETAKGFLPLNARCLSKTKHGKQTN
jgi:hypothetical protein